MFALHKPDEATVREYLLRLRAGGLSYGFSGATRSEPVARRGFKIDSERVLLGRGAATFERARQAIDRWQMFPVKMATVYGAQPPVVGLNVVVLYFASLCRLWMLFPARVVYVLDEEQGETVRYGFAYGTLAGHPERGEERFLVEWNRRDDTVWFALLAVSRPGHWLAWLGYPYTRYEQSRFRRLSGEAMQQAVA